MRGRTLRWFEVIWGLDTVRILHKGERFNATAFYVHQAAEKAVNAFLNYVHKERRIIRYSSLYLRHWLMFRRRLGIVFILDKHYIPSRCSDIYDEGAPPDYYIKEDAENVFLHR